MFSLKLFVASTLPVNNIFIKMFIIYIIHTNQNSVGFIIHFFKLERKKELIKIFMYSINLIIYILISKILEYYNATKNVMPKWKNEKSTYKCVCEPGVAYHIIS